MKSLVVEDDATCRTIMQAYLTPFGECRLAENGRDALAALAEAWEQGSPFDLVCLDIIMPEMDGHAVLAGIRDMEAARGVTSPNGIKVIMTSGAGDIDHIAQSFEKDCVAYIVKPVLKSTLLETLKELRLIP
ncbi:MAG TPA: response regulator [Deltaproteobacteria bacterium]|nr:response regulator [Deltaproteobacteria bacterium]